VGVAAGTERLADGILRTLRAADAPFDEGKSSSDGVTAGEPAMLVLENSAGSGGGLGTSVDELAGIAAAIAARGMASDRVGFCIDTAHAWGAGIDVGTPSAIDDMVAAFDKQIGLERLVMVHLNDTRSELGSRTDRHEHLGAGRIGPAGLSRVLRHPGLAHAAYLLETPGMDEGYDAINLARARALATGEPLEPLHAEAFQLRGSARARTAPA